MENPGMKIKHPKRRGEWAELKFMVRALEEGFLVSRPWGETQHYDVGAEHKGKIVRVQVKSTIFKEGAEGYSCTLKDSNGPYKKGALDYLAAYVIPEDLWYIIPAAKFLGQGSIALYPKLKKSKYGENREAWHLLRGGSKGVDRIEACAEELVRLVVSG